MGNTADDWINDDAGTGTGKERFPPTPRAGDASNVGAWVNDESTSPFAGGPPGLTTQTQQLPDYWRGVSNPFHLGDVGRAFYQQQTEGVPFGQGIEQQNVLNRAAAKRSPVSYNLGLASGNAAIGAAAGAAGLSAVPAAAARFGLAGAIPASMAEGAAWGGLQGATDRAVDPSAKADIPFDMAMGGIFGAAGPKIGQGAAATYRGTAGALGIPNALVEAGKVNPRGVQQLATGQLGDTAMWPEAGPAFQAATKEAVLPPINTGNTALIDALTQRNAGAQSYVYQNMNRLFGRAHSPDIVTADVLEPQIRRANSFYPQLYNGPNVRAIDAQPIADYLDARIPDLVGDTQRQAIRIRNGLDVYGTTGTPQQALDPFPQKMGNARSDIKATLRQENGPDGKPLAPDTRELLREVDRQMTAELQAKVPGIRDLDSHLSELHSRAEALNPRAEGSQIFDSGRGTTLTPDEFARMMQTASVPHGSMPATQVPDYITMAARAEMERLAGTRGDALTKLHQVYGPEDVAGKWNPQKSAIAFGQGPTDEFQRLLDQQWQQRQNYNEALKNSQTAFRQSAEEAQKFKPISSTDVATSPFTLISYPYNKIGQAMNERERARIADFLAVRNQADLQRAALRMQSAVQSRDVRSSLANAILQNTYRGAVSGFSPKGY